MRVLYTNCISMFMHMLMSFGCFLCVLTALQQKHTDNRYSIIYIRVYMYMYMYQTTGYTAIPGISRQLLQSPRQTDACLAVLYCTEHSVSICLIHIPNYQAIIMVHFANLTYARHVFVVSVRVRGARCSAPVACALIRAPAAVKTGKIPSYLALARSQLRTISWNLQAFGVFLQSTSHGAR